MKQINDMQDCYDCKICGFASKTIGGLQSHISHTHKLSSKEYYDTYLWDGKSGICPTCGKPTKYVNMRIGYLKHCSFKCNGNDPETQKRLGKQNYRDMEVQHITIKKRLEKPVKRNMEHLMY